MDEVEDKVAELSERDPAWRAADKHRSELTAGLSGMKGVDDPDLLSHTTSLLSTDTIPPRLLAQIVMEALGDPDATMTHHDRVFWLEFAEHMGPDYMRVLARNLAFMRKAMDF